MDKKKIWYIVISILLPVFIGFLGILLSGSMSLFDNIKKPVFAPSAILFPIAWGILYILMGISSYLVYESDSEYKKTGLIFYAIQLIVNALWTMIFFRFENFLFAFIWLLLLLLLLWLVKLIKFINDPRKSGSRHDTEEHKTRQRHQV